MTDTDCCSLSQSTAAWTARAEAAVDGRTDDCRECLAVVREGILLRRQWDVIERDAPERRRLLALLASAQSLCHLRLADCRSGHDEGGKGVRCNLCEAPSGPFRQIVPAPFSAEWSAVVDLTVDQLAEDDRYLANLLDDHTVAPETAAFAVECFRDDLHWQGTKVAVLDGNEGVDFLGRVLLEEESLRREIDAWDRNASTASVSQRLRETTEQLRRRVLGRRTETLLAQPEPEDWQGWHRAWRASSWLIRRLEPGTNGDGDASQQAFDDVTRYRERAKDAWRQCVSKASPKERTAALKHAADEVADDAAESLIFLEDVPLDEAVRTLETLAEDINRCLQAAKQENTPELRGLCRSLRRQKKTIAAELQERRLGRRMERLFGHRAVVALERSILLLLVLFVVMLAVEAPLLDHERTHWPGSAMVEATFAWIDLGICLVFLAEFSLKWFLAEPRGLYLRRNWITGLLPSIPFGFVAYAANYLVVAEAAEGFVLLRCLRYLRLPRMARWLRVARPLVRAGRLAAFVLQASDRLVRQLGPLVNRNLVLFERAAIRVEEAPYQATLSALRERFNYRASELVSLLPPSARQNLTEARIEDLHAMLSAEHVGMIVAEGAAKGRGKRELPLESVIARLLVATPAGISDRIGQTTAESVSRWCRAFDVLAVRRLPVARDLVTAGRLSNPYETTAQVANRLGALLRHALDRVYWVADLYGTVTAPQLVDSLGDWMVKGTARPTRRFLMVGLGFLVVSYLASLIPFEPLNELTRSLEKLVGAPLVIVGMLCLIPLLLGLWFRRIAGEASEFHDQVAEAQFFDATRELKRRLAKRHHAILHRRVIGPEMNLLGDKPDDRTSVVKTAVERLWNDYLEGAPFHPSDTKTSTQLLGNLALVSLRQTRLPLARRRQKQLRRLDLAASRVSLRGPYLWFRFVSRSLAHQTAKLVVDYNAHALPLSRLTTASDEEVRAHALWLRRRCRGLSDERSLPSQRDDRLDSADAEPTVDVNGAPRQAGFQGNDFTAIHFLSTDADVEADIRRRYGDAVADLMRRDRRDNMRRVFRTYPLYHWPKPRRTFNPLNVYHRHIEGGRVLLLPLKVVYWACLLAARTAWLVWTFVRDVLHPSVGNLESLGESDPYAVAVRKIHRMRKPVFLECLQMRADFDPEYLGALVPGVAPDIRGATTVPIDEDLALIGAEPGVQDRLRRLGAERRRQILAFRRWLVQFDCRDQSPESLRAMTIAYTIDYRGVRSRLEATRLLQKAFDRLVAGEQTTGITVRPLTAWWTRFRWGGRLQTLLRQPSFASYQPHERLCQRLVCRERGPLLAALKTLSESKHEHEATADPVEDARRELLAVARDPDTWSRQLLILRAVQTLSVLDLRTYCDLVAELGEYDGCT